MLHMRFMQQANRVKCTVFPACICRDTTFSIETSG